MLVMMTVTATGRQWGRGGNEGYLDLEGTEFFFLVLGGGLGVVIG